MITNYTQSRNLILLKTICDETCPRVQTTEVQVAFCDLDPLSKSKGSNQSHVVVIVLSVGCGCPSDKSYIYICIVMLIISRSIHSLIVLSCRTVSCLVLISCRVSQQPCFFSGRHKVELSYCQTLNSTSSPSPTHGPVVF